MDLTDSEIRVLGCLLEKQRTTPDHYPLSLNSLRLACNQATNREPVVDYDEAVIRDALHRLARRSYVRLAGASRAAKYRHLLAEALPMSSGEQAVMCVLMLRGPQTPGELKQRGERIHAFEGLDEVHATLTALIERGLVARLDRRPGQKEERYKQMLGEDAEVEAATPTQGTASPAGHAVHSSSSVPSSNGLAERVARLEREVAELRDALAVLRGEEPAVDAPGMGEEPMMSASDGAGEEDAAVGTLGAKRDWDEQVAQPAP
jgi:uncharacterized protein YceH (UPF0502 family)